MIMALLLFPFTLDGMRNDVNYSAFLPPHSFLSFSTSHSSES